MPAVGDPGGVWTFRFFERFDDGMPGEVDAIWTIAITFSPLGFDPPAATDLGVLSAPGVEVPVVPLVSSQVQWFTFELDAAVSLSRTGFLMS